MGRGHLLDRAIADRHRHSAVALEQLDQLGEINGICAVTHMLQIDQHGVVVEEIGIVCQALCQVRCQHRDLGVPQCHGHHGKLCTFKIKAGSGYALRVNGHGEECG